MHQSDGETIGSEIDSIVQQARAGTAKIER